MSIAGYSTCRIRFVPTDQASRAQDYSDRSLVELRQLDFADYSLRALDIANNKEVIFNIPLERSSQYKCGQTPDQPDEVLHKSGTYYLWLNASSKTVLREALDTCFEQIGGLTEEPPQQPARRRTPSPKPTRRRTPSPKPTCRRTPSPKPAPQRDSKPTPSDQSNSRPDLYSVTRDVEPKPSPHPNRNDVLVDIYQLGQNIRCGHVEKAGDLAKKLAQARVPLQSISWKDRGEEEIIPIKVRIDSYKRAHSDNRNDLTMGVYPSTTVRELRTAFEHSHSFPSSNQHFFVNGHLAHEDSKMIDLNIRYHSFFVLFVSQP